MDWQIVAAIGEILGAAGVIASLVYLAGQVRSNAAQVKEAAAQTRQAAAQSIISGFNDSLAELADPDQAEFFFPGLQNGLKTYPSYAAAAAFSARMFTFTRRYEELYHYHRAGAIDDWVWHGIDRMMTDILKNPGASEWWSVRSDWFSDDFREMVTKSISGSTQRLESDYATQLGVEWERPAVPESETS
jgi:hypothetical protein